MPQLFHKKIHMTSYQIIIGGFAAVILAGALLLMLPFSANSGAATSFGTALFTATSAVCVTGLVVRDTALHWSTFGQTVILALIQIGGMGVITMAVALTRLSGRKVSLMQRSTLQEAIAAPQMGGIVRLTAFIVKTTILFELSGAVLLMPVFCRDFGLRGVWLALFHSISAFCNAGFDLMGTQAAPFASLTRYAGDPVLSGVIASLILLGGIGFLTWDDIAAHRWHWHRYRMQTRVILVATALLIVGPSVYLYMVEYAALPAGRRFLAAVFQAVTPRTAGFNTMDLTTLSGAGQSIMIALMLVGGSPGSTAGGMKTTTIVVLLANALAVFRRQRAPRLFGRRLETGAVLTAATVLLLYVVLFFGGALIISVAESLPMGLCLFEAASAIGTVGLTLGLTPSLGALSRIVLIALMFFGRVGGLTLIYAASADPRPEWAMLPQEKITVG